MSPLLACVPLQMPVPGWRENLHMAADIAVIAAVVVGAIALVVQLRERRSRRAAVDVRLRTGALPAPTRRTGTPAACTSARRAPRRPGVRRWTRWRGAWRS